MPSRWHIKQKDAQRILAHIDAQWATGFNAGLDSVSAYEGYRDIPEDGAAEAMTILRHIANAEDS